MLAHRVIPVVLYRGTTAVKGKQFKSWRSIGHIEQQVRIYQQRGCDELVLLDIAATPEGRGPDLKLVERLTKDCFMPLTVGGGVRSVQDVRDLLNAGADKVAIGTAVCDGDVLPAAADIVGCQAIVCAMDVLTDSIGPEVMTHCGAVETAFRVYRYAKLLQAKGAGEILLTSIEREGAMEGYDLGLIKAVSDAVDIPVIANGGAGTYHHMVEAIRAGASAVAAGAMFAFTEATPKGAAQYLQEHGLEARCV